MLNSGGTLRTNIIFLTQMYTKRLVNICRKFWENMLASFQFSFASN